MTTTCCHWLRKWKSSLSVHCPKAALMMVLFSWKVTLLCRQPGLCVSSMSFLLCRQLYCFLVCVSHLCPSCCAVSCIVAWFVCFRKCSHADHFPQPPARDQRPHPADAAPAAQDYFYHTGTASVVAHWIISSSPSHRCIISLSSPHMYSLACC